MDANYSAKFGLMMRLRVAIGYCFHHKSQGYFSPLKLYHLYESQSHETLKKNQKFIFFLLEKLDCPVGSNKEKNSPISLTYNW